jgi:hypothetical protein
MLHASSQRSHFTPPIINPLCCSHLMKIGRSLISSPYLLYGLTTSLKKTVAKSHPDFPLNHNDLASVCLAIVYYF